VKRGSSGLSECSGYTSWRNRLCRSRGGKGVDLTPLQEIKDLVIGFVTRDLSVAKMRDRAAHSGRVVDGRHLDAGLIAMAMRNLPVGAISSFKPSASAGVGGL
jgi:hypothetical protein